MARLLLLVTLAACGRGSKPPPSRDAAVVADAAPVAAPIDFATCGEDGRLILWEDAPAPVERQRIELGIHGQCELRFSPDGSVLAVRHDNTVAFLATATGAWLHADSGGGSQQLEFEWIDERRVIVGNAVVDVAGVVPMRPCGLGPCRVWASPDRAHFVVADWPRAVTVRGLDGAVTARFELPRELELDTPAHAMMTPDGTHVVIITSRDGEAAHRIRWSLADGSTTVASTDDPAEQLVPGTDGAIVWAIGANRLTRVNAADGTVDTRALGLDLDPATVRHTRDRSRLAGRTSDASVVIDLDTATVVTTFDRGSLALDDDGRRAVWFWDSGVAVHREAEGWAPVRLRGHEARVVGAAFRPIAARGDASARHAAAAGAARQGSVPAKEWPSLPAAFVVGSAQQGTLTFFDPASGAVLGTDRAHLHYLGVLAISRDGRWLVSGDVSEVLVRRLDDGTRTFRRVGGLGAVAAVAISDTGERIAIATSDRAVSIWTGSGVPVARLRACEGRVTQLALRGDGGAVAWVCRWTVWLWREGDAAPRQVQTTSNRGREDPSVAWTADGVLVTSQDDELRLWDPVALDQPIRTIPVTVTPAQLVVVGDRVLMASRPPTVTAIAVADGAVAWTLALPSAREPDEVARMARSPDGSTLLVWHISEVAVVVDAVAGKRLAELRLPAWWRVGALR